MGRKRKTSTINLPCGVKFCVFRYDATAFFVVASANSTRINYSQRCTRKKASGLYRGIRQAFETETSLNRLAVKAVMECLYWLVKSDTPHITHYCSLLKAAECMGCEALKHLNHKNNANYTSQCIIQDFLQVLEEQMEQEIPENLLSSTYYSVMIDKTTDVSIINECACAHDPCTHLCGLAAPDPFQFPSHS